MLHEKSCKRGTRNLKLIEQTLPALAPSCKKRFNGFLCRLIVSLESEIHQLNFEGRD